MFALLPGFEKFGSDLAKRPGNAWLVCRRAASGGYELWREGVLEARIDLEKPEWEAKDLLAIIGLSGDPGLAELRSAWTAIASFCPIAILEASEASELSILAIAQVELSRRWREEKRNRGASILELSDYRQEFDRLQNSFSALETFVAAHGLNRPQMQFESAPATSGLETILVPGPAEPLEQLLPVNSIGVATIALWTEAAAANAREPLTFAIHAIETDAVLATWTLEPEKARQGWLRLSLGRAIDDDALSLKLVVCSKGAGWRLGLGAPVPLPEFCCRTSTGGPLRAPLAFRIFTSPPGVRVTTMTDDLSPDAVLDTSPSAVTLIDFSAAKSVSSNGRDENVVIYNADEDFVQVHTQSFGKISVARIVSNAPDRAWRLSAKIVLAHQGAMPTEFALHVAPADRDEFDPDIATGAAVAGFGFSGWRKLAPLRAETLNVYLAPDASRSLAIFLLTRQDQDPAYGWARFSELRFQTRP